MSDIQQILNNKSMLLIIKKKIQKRKKKKKNEKKEEKRKNRLCIKDWEIIMIHLVYFHNIYSFKTELNLSI